MSSSSAVGSVLPQSFSKDPSPGSDKEDLAVSRDTKNCDAGCKSHSICNALNGAGARANCNSNHLGKCDSSSESSLASEPKSQKSHDKATKMNMMNGLNSVDAIEEYDGLFFINESHSNQTMQKLNILRKNRQLCDLILQLDDDSQEIFCHQIILACNSKFFMETFNTYENEQNNNFENNNLNSPTDAEEPASTGDAPKKKLLQKIVKANHNSTQKQLLFCLSDYLKHYLTDKYHHHDAKLNNATNHNSHYHHHHYSNNKSDHHLGGDTPSLSKHHENKIHVNQSLDCEALKLCIDYMYTSQLKVPSHLIPYVYSLAYHLSIDSIVEACVNYLTKQLSVDNCLSIRSFALDEQLIEASTQCIEKNIDYILQLGVKGNLSASQSLSNSRSSLNSATNGSKQNETSPYISSSINLANKEFNHLPRINIELVGLKPPANKLPDNINCLSQLCMNWLVEQLGFYENDKENFLNDMCDNLNMLYINRTDLTLHDCCDLDSSDTCFNDHIHDYQQKHHVNGNLHTNNFSTSTNSLNVNGSGVNNCGQKCRKNSNRQSPPNLNGQVPVANGENTRLKTFKITDQELNSIGTATPIRLKVLHDNEVVCTHQTSENSFITISTLAGRLVTLCAHILPSQANPDADSVSPNGDAQPSEPTPSGSATYNDSKFFTDQNSNASVDQANPGNVQKQTSAEYTKMVKMTVARCSHGVVAYENRLYIIGGYERGECLNTCEVYDPLANTIEPMEAMQCRRGRAATVWFQKEKSIYVIGGSDGQQDLNSIEYFDIVVKKWRQIKFDFDLSCTNLGAIACKEYVYLVGFKGELGNSQSRTACLRYEPSKNEFKRLAELNNGRSQSALVWVSEKSQNSSDPANSDTNSLLFIFGGYDQIRCLSSCEVYDVEQDKWTLIPSMLEARRGCGAAVHEASKQVYIVGGTNGSQSLRSIEIYDIQGKRWTKGPDLNVARTNVAIAFIGDVLFALGGFDGKSFLRTIEYLNIKNMENGWSVYHKPSDFDFVKQ